MILKTTHTTEDTNQSNKNVNCIALQLYFMIYLNGVNLWDLTSALSFNIGWPPRCISQYHAASVLASHLLSQIIFYDTHLTASDKLCRALDEIQPLTQRFCITAERSPLYSMIDTFLH